MSCSTRKQLLLIRATKDFSDRHIAAVKAACELVDVHPVVHEFTDVAVLEEFLDGIPDDQKFAFIYLAAHGSHREFGEKTGDGTRWADFAEVLCRTQAMKPDSVLFMGCCGGGLKKVSLVLFSKCEQIVCVCGPRSAVTPEDITLALHVFLHSFVLKCEDPQIGAERTETALGVTFRHHDRHDLSAEILIVAFAGGNDPDFLTTEEIEFDRLTTTTTTTTTPPLLDPSCCDDQFQFPWDSAAQASVASDNSGKCRVAGECLDISRHDCDVLDGKWFDDPAECEACPPDRVSVS